LVGKNLGGFGITLKGFNNVQILNGTVTNYFYGIVVQNSNHPVIINNTISNNWVDPASQGPNPPILDVNVGPNLGIFCISMLTNYDQRTPQTWVEDCSWKMSNRLSL
jgi:parallel beta-helix repeat protein